MLAKQRYNKIMELLDKDGIVHTAELVKLMNVSSETIRKDLEYLERHGKPVTEKTFDSDEELLNELIREADAGMDKYETAAVLTETMDEAYTMTRMLSNRGLPVNCIDRDSSTFEKGVTVTTFYMAKGLEFDQVFGVFPKKENPMTGQAKYICATRALHELYMYERA